MILKVGPRMVDIVNELIETMAQVWLLMQLVRQIHTFYQPVVHEAIDHTLSPVLPRPCKESSQENR